MKVLEMQALADAEGVRRSFAAGLGCPILVFAAKDFSRDFRLLELLQMRSVGIGDVPPDAIRYRLIAEAYWFPKEEDLGF